MGTPEEILMKKKAALTKIKFKAGGKNYIFDPALLKQNEGFEKKKEIEMEEYFRNHPIVPRSEE